MTELQVEEIPPEEFKPNTKASAKPGLTAKAKEAFKPRNTTKTKTPNFDEDVPYLEGGYTDAVAGLYGMIAVICMPLNTDVATAFAEQAEPCAKAWDKVAKNNPAVRRALNWITKGGDYGELILAHAAIGTAIAGAVVEARSGPSKPDPADIEGTVEHAFRMNMNGQTQQS